jgi:phosphohistidine phosphatase
MPKPRGLLLVRHAKAHDSHPAGDFARALTPKGRAAFARFAARLARKHRVTRILSSPLVRAVQTAELLAQAFEVEEVEIDGALSPGEEATARLMACVASAVPGTALVGHNPALEEALQLLSEGSPALAFKKGAAASLRAEAAGTWRLEWLRSIDGERLA